MLPPAPTTTQAVLLAQATPLRFVYQVCGDHTSAPAGAVVVASTTPAIHTTSAIRRSVVTDPLLVVPRLARMVKPKLCGEGDLDAGRRGAFQRPWPRPAGG